MSLVSIDLSLRMAGLVKLGADGYMHDFKVIQTKKEQFDDEFLLLHVEEEVLGFICDADGPPVTAVVIEGLAFGAKSSRSDLIAGNWWHVKAEIRRQFPDMLIGAIPVTSWRSKTVSKEIQKEYKDRYKTDALKKAVVDHTNTQAKNKFLAYIEENKLPKAAIYDLCDSFCLGHHRLTKGSITCQESPVLPF